MVVRSGPRRGVGIEAPQQHSAVGFPQLVEVAGRESPGHTAAEDDLEYFRLQETDLIFHCDVWVVVHRPAVLEEAVPGVARTAFDLGANAPNPADGAAKIHEGVDLAVPLPRGLHGNRFVTCFLKYSRAVYDNPYIAVADKVRFLKAEVLKVMLYGCVTWTLSPGDFDKLREAHRGMLLRCLNAYTSTRAAPDYLYPRHYRSPLVVHDARKNPSSCDCAEIRTRVPTSEGFEVTN